MQNLANINKQTGWTMWSIMFAVFIVLTIVFLGTKLTPIYMANKSITSAMQTIMDGATQQNFKPSRVRRKLDDLLYVDNYHEILNYKEEVVLKKSKGNFVLQINYEREVPLFLGFRLVKQFDNVAEKKIN